MLPHINIHLEKSKLVIISTKHFNQKEKVKVLTINIKQTNIYNSPYLMVLLLKVDSHSLMRLEDSLTSLYSDSIFMKFKWKLIL